MVDPIISIDCVSQRVPYSPFTRLFRTQFLVDLSLSHLLPLLSYYLPRHRNRRIDVLFCCEVILVLRDKLNLALGSSEPVRKNSRFIFPVSGTVWRWWPSITAFPRNHSGPCANPWFHLRKTGQQTKREQESQHSHLSLCSSLRQPCCLSLSVFCCSSRRV